MLIKRKYVKMKEKICEILGISTASYYRWKEDRKIIKMLEKYFKEEDLQEFLETGQMSKLEALNNSNQMQKILERLGAAERKLEEFDVIKRKFEEQNVLNAKKMAHASLIDESDQAKPETGDTALSIVAARNTHKIVPASTPPHPNKVFSILVVGRDGTDIEGFITWADSQTNRLNDKFLFKTVEPKEIDRTISEIRKLNPEIRFITVSIESSTKTIVENLKKEGVPLEEIEERIHNDETMRDIQRYNVAPNVVLGGESIDDYIRATDKIIELANFLKDAEKQVEKLMEEDTVADIATSTDPSMPQP